MNKVKILIFDDHEVIIDGLKFALSDKDRYEVEGVLNEENFIEKIRKKNYDVFIFDYMIPGTNILSLISRVQESFWEAKIIVLSSLKDEKLYTSLKEKKVNGYLFKSEVRSVIEEALIRILSGEDYYSNLENAFLDNLRHAGNPFDTLTQKELEIVKFLIQKKSNGSIAEQLGISLRTVEAHKRNIDMKLGKLSKSQLTKLAEMWKLQD